MRKKLSNILLVDDDTYCNEYHRRLLNKMNCVERIHTARDGQAALDFLTKKNNRKYPAPEIIFLDISMPGMGGWMFLEEYKKLDDDVKAKTIIIMTTSLSIKDTEKALNSYSVNGFYNKYLTESDVTEILTKYFTDNVQTIPKINLYKVMEFLGKTWKYFFN